MKWIVFSVCTDGEDQSFGDVVVAKSEEEAIRKVKRGRPYVEIEGATLLAKYIGRLVDALAQTDKETEKEWKEIAEPG